MVQMLKGAVYATMLKRKVEVGAVGVGLPGTNSQKLTLKQAHAKLGHSGIEKTQQTAKCLGWVLSDGVMDPCASCAAGKAKRRMFLSNP